MKPDAFAANSSSKCALFFLGWLTSCRSLCFTGTYLHCLVPSLFGVVFFADFIYLTGVSDNEGEDS